VFCLAKIYDFDLVAFKAPQVTDVSRLKTPKHLFEALLALPLVTLGTILQVIMNFQSKTFAGEYRLSACLNFLSDLCILLAAYLHPPTFTPAMPRLILHFYVVLGGVMVFQSFVYPKPRIVGEIDDD